MKTVIVTGASGNLGQAVVKKFIGGGYTVIGTVAPNDNTPMDFPADRFEKIVVDLMNEEDAQQFVDSVIGKYGPVDAAVLTVGGFATGKIAETKTSDMVKQYKLNFETAYHVARPVFLQMMMQGSGRIFMIGSKPGLDARNSKGMVAYGLSKSLIFRLGEMMNDEAKGTNVVTCIVVPSTIDTPQNRASMPEEKFNKWVKPEHIAETIFFYCSEAATAIRGPVIRLYNNA